MQLGVRTQVLGIKVDGERVVSTARSKRAKSDLSGFVFNVQWICSKQCHVHELSLNLAAFERAIDAVPAESIEMGQGTRPRFE